MIAEKYVDTQGSRELSVIEEKELDTQMSAKDTGARVGRDYSERCGTAVSEGGSVVMQQGEAKSLRQYGSSVNTEDTVEIPVLG